MIASQLIAKAHICCAEEEQADTEGEIDKIKHEGLLRETHPVTCPARHKFAMRICGAKYKDSIRQVVNGEMLFGATALTIFVAGITVCRSI